MPCRYAWYCSGVPIGTWGIIALCGKGRFIISKYASQAARDWKLQYTGKNTNGQRRTREHWGVVRS